MQLFEKNTARLLDDTNFAAFSRKYQTEQAETMEKLNGVNAELSKAGETVMNAEKLRASTLSLKY